MAATKVGIVYATGSGILRRWIVPDNDTDLIQFHTVGRGETLLMVDSATIPADPTLATPFVEAAVARVIGRSVPSARCAVVDQTGAVVSVIMADPALDAMPNCSLMLHATADVGWAMSAGTLAAPVAVVANADVAADVGAPTAQSVASDLGPA